MKSFASVKSMTSQNFHCEALIEAADIIGGAPAAHIRKKLIKVNEIVELEGELPMGINEYRYSLYKQLKVTAANVLNADEYDDFIGSL